MVKKIKIIMIMIDEEKKLTTISLLKTPKYKRFSPSHGHTIANYEIYTKKRKEKEARRRFIEKRRQFGN
jgi:hypothetical protein